MELFFSSVSNKRFVHLLLSCFLSFSSDNSRKQRWEKHICKSMNPMGEQVENLDPPSTMIPPPTYPMHQANSFVITIHWISDQLQAFWKENSKKGSKRHHTIWVWVGPPVKKITSHFVVALYCLPWFSWSFSGIISSLNLSLVRDQIQLGMFWWVLCPRHPNKSSIPSGLLSRSDDSRGYKNNPKAQSSFARFTIFLPIFCTQRNLFPESFFEIFSTCLV